VDAEVEEVDAEVEEVDAEVEEVDAEVPFDAVFISGSIAFSFSLSISVLLGREETDASAD
jgi:hypothetical protein